MTADYCPQSRLRLAGNQADHSSAYGGTAYDGTARFRIIGWTSPCESDLLRP
jgi:hypothetical protein